MYYNTMYTMLTMDILLIKCRKYDHHGECLLFISNARYGSAFIIKTFIKTYNGNKNKILLNRVNEIFKK